MKFCNHCENMLYIRLLNDDSNKLIYYCRNCGTTDNEINADNVCVSNTNINTKENAYLNDINEYTKLDPTLPRSNTIPCPNEDCICNTENKENKVIYIRYDDTNLKYVYLCTYCDTTWNTNINK